jgi:rare lipoprotein A
LPEKMRVVPRASSTRIFIQAGAFSVRDNAQKLQARVASLGSVQVMTASVGGIEMYRVRLGPLASVEEADQLLARVVDSGYPEARIVVD